jgi:phage terminase small subunit
MSEKATFDKVKVLTQKQRNFCRAYVIKDDKLEAVLASYDTTDRKSADRMGRHLLEQAAIRQYIGSIRWDIETKMEGLPAYCIKQLMEGIEIAKDRQQASALAQCVDVLNKMQGYGRRVHPFNLAEHDGIEAKLKVVDDAYAQGKITSFELQVLVQRIRGGESDQVMGDMQKELKAMEARQEKMTKAPGRCERADTKKTPIPV